MFYSFAADLVFVFHLLFIIFAGAGSLFVLKWSWVAILHIPAAIWATLIEFKGWICPLTPLENYLRHAAGEAGYSGGFIAHYLIPIIYPDGLTRDIQIVIGVIFLVINLSVYGWALTHWLTQRQNR